MGKMGGRRPGAGRRPIPVSQRMITLAFAARQDQIERYGRAAEAAGLKRSEWFRRILDKATVQALRQGGG